MIYKKIFRVFKFILIVFLTIVILKIDINAQYYNFDASSYIAGHDIVHEEDIDYNLDYKKWSSYFNELKKYLKPEYVNIWNDVEGVDFYHVYYRKPRGIEGIGINSDMLIEGQFGYYGVLHSAEPYNQYSPEVYKFKNLIDKLKNSEIKERFIVKKVKFITNKIKSFFSLMFKHKNEINKNEFEIVEFGHNKFGKPMQWIILDKNEIKNEYLLLSRDKFNNISEDKNSYITWNQSKIRKYLNEEFYEVSFTDNEKERIVLVDFFDNQLKENINDKVFILSYDEIKKYLYNNEKKFYNFVFFTYYEWDGNDAVLEYSYNNKLFKRHTRDIFTIRDLGYRNKTFSSIDVDGNIFPFETHIHPAIWVKYNVD